MIWWACNTWKRAWPIWPWNRPSFSLLQTLTRACTWTHLGKEEAGCTWLKGRKTGISWGRRQKPTKVVLSLAPLTSLTYHPSSLISVLVRYSMRVRWSQVTLYISLLAGCTELRRTTDQSVSAATSYLRHVFLSQRKSVPNWKESQMTLKISSGQLFQMRSPLQQNDWEAK